MIPKKYNRKISHVIAFQVNDGILPDLNNLLGEHYRCAFVDPRTDILEVQYVNDMGDLSIALRDDWIMEGPKGGFYHTSDEKFRALYDVQE